MDNVNFARKELFLMRISNSANLFVPKMKNILKKKKNVSAFKVTSISMGMIFVQNALKQQNIPMKRSNVFALKNNFNIQKMSKNANWYVQLMNN